MNDRETNEIHVFHKKNNESQHSAVTILTNVLPAYRCLVCVYQQPISNIDELRERTVAVWEVIDQRVIDAARCQWQKRFLACVKAKGGHFQHFNIP